MAIFKRCVVFVMMAILSAGEARAADPAWNPEAAGKYLDARGKWWLEWPSASRGQKTACISCHTTFPLALARPALGRQLGETAASDIEKRLIDNVTKRVENW